MYFLYQGFLETLADSADFEAKAFLFADTDAFLRTAITPPQTMSGFHPAWVKIFPSLPFYVMGLPKQPKQGNDKTMHGEESTKRDVS
jgi:hypothetical protein